MKRAEANDLLTICQMGKRYARKGDYSSALEYFTRAARSGYTDARFELAAIFLKGQGVEKDRNKALNHWEEAAIGGHPQARHNLGIHEKQNDNIERAVKHFIIAANLGWDDSLKLLRACYADREWGRDLWQIAILMK